MPSEPSQIFDMNESENIDNNVKKEPKELTDSPDGKKLHGKTKYVFQSSPTALFSLPECRTLVKVIICGIKTAAWGIATLKVCILFCLSVDYIIVKKLNLHLINLYFFISILLYKIFQYLPNNYSKYSKFNIYQVHKN